MTTLHYPKSASRAIVSCDEASEAFALDELRPILPANPCVTWLQAGMALIETGTSFDTFAAEVERNSSVFIRHIAPAQHSFTLSGEVSDLDVLVAEVRQFADAFHPDQSFAVQTRIIGDLPVKRVTINEALSSVVTKLTGAPLDTRVPHLVLSVLCTPESGYMGVSSGVENRSLWPGGAHRFKREEGQVSRAEFKLLEAISVFDLSLPDSGLALDIGAAPGGWTRVLRSRGLQVVAVDPAELDSRIVKDRGIKHVRATIQSYLPTAPLFHLIVNDMRMDAMDSAQLMVSARSRLREGGLAVVTLKLPEQVKAARHNPELVQGCLKLLGTSYRLIGARQLYHNRSEVTVALRSA